MPPYLRGIMALWIKLLPALAALVFVTVLVIASAPQSLYA
jgi:hypothetical protein